MSESEMGGGITCLRIVGPDEKFGELVFRYVVPNALAVDLDLAIHAPTADGEGALCGGPTTADKILVCGPISCVDCPSCMEVLNGGP